MRWLKIWILLGVVVSVSWSDIQFLTHPLRPFSFIDENDQLNGVAVELVQEMMKLRKQEHEIIDVSFKRALKIAQTKKSSALFIVMKTKERESTLKWVGPLFSNGVYVYVNRQHDPGIKTFDDLKKLKMLGVGLGNTDHKFFTDKGFKNLIVAYNQEESVQQLYHGRIDATPMGEMVFDESVKAYGLKPERFKKTDVKLYDSKLYLVFSKDIPDEEVSKWQEVLDQLKQNGTYDQIMKRYF